MLRRITAILVSLSVVAATAGPVGAFEGTEGVVVDAYLSVPLGGGQAERRAPSFGFAADVSRSFGAESRSSGEPYRPARLADVRFTPQRLSALSFGGLDVLDSDLRLDAAGDEEGGGINWLYVLLGIGGAGLVAAAGLTEGAPSCDSVCRTKKLVKCTEKGGVFVNFVCEVP